MPQDGDWLNNWLSGPLPGQPVTSRNALQTNSVTWPVSPGQRAVPKRLPVQNDERKRPSLKRASSENRLYRRTDLPDMYLGVGLVASTGATTWNHDATSSSTTLGNPSSELTYENVGTTALEFNGGMTLRDAFFVRGAVGFGLTTGSDANFRDDDFLAGQTLFSSTDSVIADSDLFYLTLDAGREIINVRDSELTLSLFAGYQYWTETYRAYGLYNRLTGSKTQADSTAVIENQVQWNSVRVGAIGTYRPNDRLEWMLDFAFVPYTAMHNEDSHLLRTASNDLGPAPNVIMDGSGYGYEWAVGMSYLVTPRISATLDFRYWALMSDGEITLGPNTATPSVFPLNDLDSFRYGVNAGMKYSF